MNTNTTNTINPIRVGRLCEWHTRDGSKLVVVKAIHGERATVQPVWIGGNGKLRRQKNRPPRRVHQQRLTPVPTPKQIRKAARKIREANQAAYLTSEPRTMYEHDGEVREFSTYSAWRRGKQWSESA